jgi:hypothetical protein
MRAAAQKRAERKVPGVEVRHQKACAEHEGGVCNCKPSYRAIVFDRRERRKIQKTFPTLAAAAAWWQELGLICGVS